MKLDFNQNLQQSELKLVESTQKLGFSINSSDISKIAYIIAESMSDTWRCFHTLDHVFMVGDSDNPIEVLAALFHDLVYVQIDNKINLKVKHYLTPFIEEKSPNIFKVKNSLEIYKDSHFAMVISIFGFENGQKLNSSLGQNEFLSALAATKILQPFLPLSILAKIVTIIEATIPFRAKSHDGFTPSEMRYKLLQTTNEKFNLGLSLEEIEETIKHSVNLVNRDVSSFASATAKDFLMNTWKLIPENNHNIINGHFYTIKDYRLTIYKMIMFFDSLQPESIFSRFRNQPKPEIYLHLINQAKQNLTIGKYYFTSKLITVCLLEAIAIKLKIENNFSLEKILDYFLNNDQNNHNNLLKNSLNSTQNNLTKNDNFVEQEVLSLLTDNTLNDLIADYYQSILTRFLISEIGFNNLIKLKPLTINFINNDISEEELISAFPNHLIDSILNNLTSLTKS